jgi:DNA-binding transcriptional LysR family regulator
MPAPLDIDSLQTFLAVVDTGSFTRASGQIHKTQSAVSMQIKRLEEQLGQQLFNRAGRSVTLSPHGERLLVYARRMVDLSSQTLAAFNTDVLLGAVRIGTPDDYADRYLPEILARFAVSNPKVEVTVICEPSSNLHALIAKDELDLAIVTQNVKMGSSEILRNEPIHWVTSDRHVTHEEEVLPVAFGRQSCLWRQWGLAALGKVEKRHRLLYSSWSTMVIASAVLSGLAISVLPESAIQPGMRILGENDGFPELPASEIALIRSRNPTNKTIEAMINHIRECLGSTFVNNEVFDTPTLNNGRRTASKPIISSAV